MVFLATKEVVQRVRPLLERFGGRTIEKAQLLQYLSAMAGVQWGVFEVVGTPQTTPGAMVALRDRTAGTTFTLAYPDCLPREVEPFVIAEYQRLAVARPLTTMDADLFAYLFRGGYCVGCQWQGEKQVCRECHYAGHPINYEPFYPEAAPPLDESFLPQE